jgi:hypothetical protein
MNSYEWINREWLISPTARRVYRISAALSITSFVALWFVFFDAGMPRAVAPFARLLLFAGALGTCTTFVGMEYFLFRFDDSHPLKQIAWFCVMLVPLLGPALYCFIVYSRSEAVKNSGIKRPEDMPA